MCHYNITYQLVHLVLMVNSFRQCSYYTLSSQLFTYSPNEIFCSETTWKYTPALLCTSIILQINVVSWSTLMYDIYVDIFLYIIDYIYIYIIFLIIFFDWGVAGEASINVTRNTTMHV